MAQYLDLAARDNRMEMTNQGVKSLLAINAAGAGSMLTLLQFTAQQNLGPKPHAIFSLGVFAFGMLTASLINFFRVQSSLAHVSNQPSRYAWLGFIGSWPASLLRHFSSVPQQ